MQNTIDKSCERLDELLRYFFPRKIRSGEITAILRRMGQPGFGKYIQQQKSGMFGPRSFMPSNKDDFVKTITLAYPEYREEVLNIADKVVEGRFSLLGSKDIDMRRRFSSLGSAIDWNKDPITGEIYSQIFSQWRWNPTKMQRGNADVKGPWELTRCQHFSVLGTAYWLTDDSRYAQCYAKTISDFITRNPSGFGVHWACNMDVSLRAVGWLVGLSFFQGSHELTTSWWKTFLRSLVDHGRYIAANLEYGTIDGRLVASNHNLSNLFGLFWIAHCFPHLDAGVTWRGIAERALEHEIRIQMLPDGTNFESSLPYHRLVTEMFLSAYALSLHVRSPLSKGYKKRLLRALMNIRDLRQANGRIPQIGDNDSGRAHKLADYGKNETANMDHLLLAGAKVLNAPALIEGLVDQHCPESLYWNVAAKDVSVLPKQSDTLVLKDAGIAVLRSNFSYVSISNGSCGTEGFGNHKHNDQLAIEWAVGKQSIFVDAGSYTYTQDVDERNRFRSVKMHNTVCVSDEEQNELIPEHVFRLYERGKKWIRPAIEKDGYLSVEAGHSAYEFLDQPVRHQRLIVMEQETGVIEIEDTFSGLNTHCLRWFFLLDPKITVSIHQDVVTFGRPDEIASLTSTPALPWQVEEAEYSPGYGHKVPCLALVANLKKGVKRVTIKLVPRTYPLDG